MTIPEGHDAPDTVDVLFNNFEILTSFRNNFTSNLKKLGETEPTWLYMWIAHTRDHKYIPNIERDGTVNRFGVVKELYKSGNLDALYMVPRVKDLPSHKVTIPVGCKPIAAYRTGISKLSDNRVIRFVQYYLLGFHTTVDGKNFQVMRIIKPSGEYRDTTNFKLRWVSESDNDGVPALLYPRNIKPEKK